MNVCCIPSEIMVPSGANIFTLFQQINQNLRIKVAVSTVCMWKICIEMSMRSQVKVGHMQLTNLRPWCEGLNVNASWPWSSNRHWITNWKVMILFWEGYRTLALIEPGVPGCSYLESSLPQPRAQNILLSPVSIQLPKKKLKFKSWENGDYRVDPCANPSGGISALQFQPPTLQ